jgi:hypothetical protein
MAKKRKLTSRKLEKLIFSPKTPCIPGNISGTFRLRDIALYYLALKNHLTCVTLESGYIRVQKPASLNHLNELITRGADIQVLVNSRYFKKPVEVRVIRREVIYTVEFVPDGNGR